VLSKPNGGNSLSGTAVVRGMSPRDNRGEVVLTPLTPEEERLLKIDPEVYNINNLPPGFDPPPKLPLINKECSSEEYKAFMVAKYEFETWENKLILYKIKLKKQIDEIKKKRGM